MKLCLVFGCFLLLISTGFTQPTASAAQGYGAKLNVVTDRVRRGDYSALNDVATMPASIAVPYLQFWTGPGNVPQQQEAAMVALRNVQGYADYLRQDMEKMVAEERVPVGDFEILEKIGTPEAAAVAATHLFDFKTRTPQDGDIAGDSILEEAMFRLSRMKLPDAPKDSPDTPVSVALVKWQKWAIAKGFVPKDWISRVGAPAWMLQMDAAIPSAPITAAPPQPMQTGNSPQPLPPREVQHASNGTSTVESVKTLDSAKEPVRAAKNYGGGMVELITILVVVIVSSVYFIWRRQKQ